MVLFVIALFVLFFSFLFLPFLPPLPPAVKIEKSFEIVLQFEQMFSAIVLPAPRRSPKVMSAASVGGEAAETVEDGRSGKASRTMNKSFCVCVSPPTVSREGQHAAAQPLPCVAQLVGGGSRGGGAECGEHPLAAGRGQRRPGALRHPPQPRGAPLQDHQQVPGAVRPPRTPWQGPLVAAEGSARFKATPGAQRRHLLSAAGRHPVLPAFLAGDCFSSSSSSSSSFTATAPPGAKTFEERQEATRRPHLKFSTSSHTSSSHTSTSS